MNIEILVYKYRDYLARYKGASRTLSRRLMFIKCSIFRDVLIATWLVIK